MAQMIESGDFCRPGNPDSPGATDGKPDKT